MLDYQSVYKNFTERYHQLVMAEAVDKDLARSLEALCTLPGSKVVEADAVVDPLGTGAEASVPVLSEFHLEQQWCRVPECTGI